MKRKIKPEIIKILVSDFKGSYWKEYTVEGTFPELVRHFFGQNAFGNNARYLKNGQKVYYNPSSPKALVKNLNIEAISEHRRDPKFANHFSLV